MGGRSVEEVEELVSKSKEWRGRFSSHPAVVGRRRGDPPVIPWALYLDGIRFTKQAGSGRAQSLLAFTAYNLLSMKRHLICVINKRWLCPCGCRAGACTLWSVFWFLRWAVEAAEAGQRPELQHDATSPFGELAGSYLAARFILVLIKGDWVEYISSLGFPSFSSIFYPCLFCGATRDSLHEYEDLCLESDAWGVPPDYSVACSACEIIIRITSEAERQMVLVVGGLHYDKRARGARGRTLQHDVPTLAGVGCGRFLRKGDRLDPSPSLPDIGRFREMVVPFECVFWRRSLEGGPNSACTDPVLWRNPLLSLFTRPIEVLAVDTLHALYLGPGKHFVGHIIWRALTCNLWPVEGPPSVQHEVRLRNVLSDIGSWYDRNGIDHSLRIGELTFSMVGSEDRPDFGGKAAESGVLVRWAADFANNHSAVLREGQHLAVAGGGFGQGVPNPSGVATGYP